MYSQGELVVYEHGNSLIISEKKNGALVKLLEVRLGVATKAQLAYYEANLRGKLKQIEADLILKYFYGIE